MKILIYSGSILATLILGYFLNTMTIGIITVVTIYLGFLTLWEAEEDIAYLRLVLCASIAFLWVTHIFVSDTLNFPNILPYILRSP